MSTVIMSNIQLWKQKAKEGTLTRDEMRQAVAAIRAERIGAGVISATFKEKKATAKKAPIDSDALLQNFLL